MTPIPPRLRKDLANDPFYKHCALADYHECGGRVTWEHALIFAGRQIQRRYAIVPVCEAGQEVGAYQDAHTMDKQMNIWVALNRATDEELTAISRAIDYRAKRARLNAIYGWYREPVPLASVPINTNLNLFTLYSLA